MRGATCMMLMQPCLAPSIMTLVKPSHVCAMCEHQNRSCIPVKWGCNDALPSTPCAKQQRQTGLQSSAEEDDAGGALADQDAGKQAGVATGGALSPTLEV